MYEVIFSENARKQFSKLEKSIQERILATLERARIRPEAHLERLVGFPYFKLKASDYRIIIELDRGNLIIHVIKIGHRKNIYDKL